MIVCLNKILTQLVNAIGLPNSKDMILLIRPDARLFVCSKNINYYLDTQYTLPSKRDKQNMDLLRVYIRFKIHDMFLPRTYPKCPYQNIEFIIALNISTMMTRLSFFISLGMS